MKDLIDKWPFLEKVAAAEEVFWRNPRYEQEAESLITMNDVLDAEKRLARFAPYIAAVFPETVPARGMIESPLRTIKPIQEVGGNLMLKCDNVLPISGSIKARGGIYEVLKHAETLAFEHGLLKESDDYSMLTDDSFASFFSNYSIAVGSTGNLGLKHRHYGSNTRVLCHCPYVR